MTKLKTLTAAITFATFGFASSAVMAQAPDAAPAQQGGAPSQQFEQGQQTGPVTDSDLNKFVEANAAVSDIRNEFTEKLNQESDQEKAQQLQMQAQEKMLQAVQDHDMDALTYNAIAARLQTDTELQERLSALQ